MRNDRWLVWLLLLGLCSPTLAQNKGKKGGGAAVTNGGGKKVSAKAVAPSTPVSSKEASVDVKITFSSNEQEVLRAYVKSCTAADKPGKKAKGLPPGLAKKVAGGGELPPGWRKKCIRGEIMPPDIFKLCLPLPHELVVKLPAPPSGTILLALDGRVFRLDKKSHKIHAVIDVM